MKAQEADILESKVESVHQDKFEEIKEPLPIIDPLPVVENIDQFPLARPLELRPPPSIKPNFELNPLLNSKAAS